MLLRDDCAFVPISWEEGLVGRVNGREDGFCRVAEKLLS